MKSRQTSILGCTKRWALRSAVVLGWLWISIVWMGANDEERAQERPVAERATALGSVGEAGVVGWDTQSLWRQQTMAGAVADALGIEPPYEGGYALAASSVAALKGELYIRPPNPADRKIVMTGDIRLIVAKPADAAEEIRKIAEQLGGYVAGHHFAQNGKEQGAGVVVRVPAQHFQEARARIKKLAVRVASESTEASDVTKEYVDMESAIRSPRAEEAQYLLIMRRATTVKDVLEVSSRLADVRGRIEKAESEFRALSRQVDMASLEARLATESEAQILGIEWRPWYHARVSFRNGMQSLANYVDAMTAFLLKLPAIVLWAATFVLVIRFSWRILVWLWGRRFQDFMPAPQATPRP